MATGIGTRFFTDGDYPTGTICSSFRNGAGQRLCTQPRPGCAAEATDGHDPAGGGRAWERRVIVGRSPSPTMPVTPSLSAVVTGRGRHAGNG
jgi:hypothetical protein